uniref:Inhibitor I9 domain-containing protein n=1 Tax=Leersia perrieri TaxID=77586 RepID=A0A0D9V6Q0_9ORYZ
MATAVTEAAATAVTEAAARRQRGDEGVPTACSWRLPPGVIPLRLDLPPLDGSGRWLLVDGQQRQHHGRPVFGLSRTVARFWHNGSGPLSRETSDRPKPPNHIISGIQSAPLVDDPFGTMMQNYGNEITNYRFNPFTYRHYDVSGNHLNAFSRVITDSTLSHLNAFTISNESNTAHGSRKLYIAYLGDVKHGHPDDVIASHHDMLTTVLGSKEDSLASIVHNYKHGFSGFAAMLTEDQAKQLAEFPEVISVKPSRACRKATTRSWDMLGLNNRMPTELLHRTNYGEDIIIGIVDSG